MALRRRTMTRAMADAAGLLAAGMKTKEIAKELDLKESTILTWMKREDFESYFRALLNSSGRMRYARALKVLEKQLDDKNPWVAQGAARDLATRFEKAVTGIDNNKITVTLEGIPELGTPDNEEV